MGSPDTSGSPPASHDPAVLARGLVRRYGPRKALDGVDLSLDRGEFLTIFGPNGAGKSTLLKAIASLIRLTAGSLAVFGLDTTAAPERIRRRLGLIAHSTFLYGGLSARDNLRFFARLHDVPDPRRRADAMLDRVGLAERADDLVRTFSRGMQQRLSIARALLHDPDLVLLDEPYTGLDHHASRALRGMLEQVRARGRTVMMVTHHLEEGLELSTRIAIMTSGRLAFEAPAGGLSRAALERTYVDVVGEAGR